MDKKHITSAISQAFGKFASYKFYKPIQNIINSSYVSIMGLDMGEFHDPSTYKSLNELFTRRLREPRDFSLDSSDFISPCDSLVSEVGTIENGIALQIKGMSYSVDELLGDTFKNKEILDGGSFINLYLSPKDYHRYHIPTNLKVLRATHIPGKFYPVNIPSLNKRANLFSQNERVVIECETSEAKRFYMVLVSALNVGVMQVSFDDRIKTNASALTPQTYEYDDLYLDKGDDFGCFEMGSTIVLLTQKDMLEPNVIAHQRVKFGENLAKLV
ncbi:MAG: phosphatidylserine decarboxylase [Sulfurimonadaceae bacterium]|jgi:phosphatidylserine decarboxylase|nr:phosphatidylserine decarboxylase [Sulfurimonadaceae bacterium]